MKCPYCNEQMIKGYIYGDRYMMKWMPEEKNLVLGIWVRGGIKLGEYKGLGRPRVETHMCHECNKFIIDMNIETHN